MIRPPPPPPKKSSEAAAEIVVEMKLIPETNWSICLTNKDHELFYNHLDQSLNTWQVPDEIMDLVGELLNQAMELQDDHDLHDNDQEDNQKEDDEQETESAPLKRAFTVVIEEEEEEQEEQDQQITKKQKVEKTFNQLVNEFHQALQDHKVSPFSTWTVVEEKLVQDERIAQLPPQDQSQLFEKWCNVEAEKELERKKQMGPKEKYLSLLEEGVTSIRAARFDDFARRFKRDSRFLAITDNALKQTLFTSHLQTLKEREREKARTEFDQLLNESASWIGKETTFEQVSTKLASNLRYLALKNPTERDNKIKLFLKKYT